LLREKEMADTRKIMVERNGALLPDEEQLECQICGEVETEFLGSLGYLDHFRCRACGIETALSNLQPPKEDKK
jgi:hypothetical protein